jgi:PAS domain S-box-containing protein
MALAGGRGRVRAPFPTRRPGKQEKPSAPRADWPDADLRVAFDESPCGTVFLDAAGEIVACNAQFARMTGFASPADAVGANVRDLEAEPGALDAFERRLSATHDAMEEFTLLRRDGRRLRMLVHAAADTDASGAIVQLRGYLVDISGRTRLEAALRESEERRELIERATSDVAWEWTVDTGRVWWNAAGPVRFRYGRDEVGAAVEWHIDRIHPDDRERVVGGLHAAVSGVEESWSAEYRLLRGDGRYAVVLDRALIVRGERGEAVRVVGCMVDITERTRAETAQRFLARASATLEATLNVKRGMTGLARLCVPALAGCCLIDIVEHDGSITTIATVHGDRARARALRKQQQRSDMGRGAAVTRVVRTGESLLVADAAADAFSEEHTTRWAAHELALVGDGSYMIVPMKVRGRVVGAITLCTAGTGDRYQPVDLILAEEIASRAALALDNARLYETARRALRARREVLALVSHDLRTPLQTISATTSLIREHLPSSQSESIHWLGVLDRATEQMNSLIGDLLDVASMEAGHFAVRTTVHDARTLLLATRELLEPLTQARHIELETHAPHGVGSVIADEAQILRVLENLVGNAVKFTPTGGKVIVRVTNRDGWVRFEVEDTGPGIPVDQRARVFERFWQGDGGDRRGAGLGLAIARGIVEAHGGRIGVDGVEGKGSLFWFALSSADETGRRAQPGATPDRRTPRQGEAGAPTAVVT